MKQYTKVNTATAILFGKVLPPRRVTGIDESTPFKTRDQLFIEEMDKRLAAARRTEAAFEKARHNAEVDLRNKEKRNAKRK